MVPQVQVYGAITLDQTAPEFGTARAVQVKESGLNSLRLTLKISTELWPERSVCYLAFRFSSWKTTIFEP